MRQLLEDLRQQLTDFIAQRDAVLLEVDCRDEDIPLVFKTLSDIDRRSESDLFVLSLDDFVDPASYVQGLVASVRLQMTALAEPLAAAQRPALTPLPPVVEDAEQAPLTRLTALLQHVRTWPASDGGHYVVWGLFPLRVMAPPAYAALLRALLVHDSVAPWMRATRLVVRARRELAVSPLGRYARRMAADFSPPTLADAIAKEAQDPALPEGQRAQSLLTLAQLDSAHGRPEAACTHYSQVIEYAERSQNHTLHALALNGLGELAHRDGDFVTARAFYECAVKPVCASRAPVLLALLSRNLGDLAFLQKRYQEADRHYDAWQQLAATMLDAEGRVQALQKRALCQLQLNRWSDGRDTLEAAATLGRNLELWGLHRYTLTELGRLYGQLGDMTLHRAMERELKALPEKESAHG